MHTGRVLHEISTSVEALYPSTAISLTTTLSPHVHRQDLFAAAHGAVDHALPLTAVHDRSIPVGQSIRRTGRKLDSAEKMGRW